MLKILAASAGLVAITIAIHGFGLEYWKRYMLYRFVDTTGDFKRHKALPAVTWTAIVLLILHFLEIIAWALAYQLLLPGDALKTFEEAVYFSAVTFTTLGYGDITLAAHEWRLLGGLQALNGALLVGWSTAMLFLVVQRGWTSITDELEKK